MCINWCITDKDLINAEFNVKVSETNPDGFPLRNLDFLEEVEVVGISCRVVRRGENATYWLLYFRGR